MADYQKEDKRSVAQIVLDNLLKDVDERGSMPWQRPYERYDSFNYFSKKAYRGINRLILPGGEYLTRNQINTYNKEHKEDFRFQKGIMWFPVIFFKPDVRPSSAAEFAELFPDCSFDENFYKFSDGWMYHVKDGKFLKKRNILRYYMVAERKHFKNSKGECLPSRIETGEIVITKQNPQAVMDDYVKRSGVTVTETLGTPCYMPISDTVELNHHIRSEEEYFSVAFHELAHSTGHESRLCREGIISNNAGFGSDLYAKEECIAEIAACLCCAETGINDMVTSGSMAYDNNVSYIQAWKKRVKDWGKEFIYIVSQADKAFQYICPSADAGLKAADSEE